ncbi:MAG: adenine phosphoribosyltransferase [Acidobacteriota bacterium]|jgi:adenine phosphoribosyltransferase
MLDLATYIRDVPDFPKPGILFKDITPLLGDPGALREAADRMAAPWRDAGVRRVAGLEARGFILGPLVAERLGVGFVPIRKAGKLPAATLAQEYSLEYGVDRIEMHADAVTGGERVGIVDDLLATGGTAAAAVSLVRKAGGVVAGLSFLVELTFLKGRERLDGIPIEAQIRY